MNPDTFDALKGTGLHRIIMARIAGPSPDLDDGLEYMHDKPLMNETILSEYDLEVEG